MTTFRLTNPIEFPTPKIQSPPFFARKLSRQEWIFIGACITFVILVILLIVRVTRKSNRSQEDTPTKIKATSHQTIQNGGYNSPFTGFSG